MGSGPELRGPGLVSTKCSLADPLMPHHSPCNCTNPEGPASVGPSPGTLRPHITHLSPNVLSLWPLIVAFGQLYTMSEGDICPHHMYTYVLFTDSGVYSQNEDCQKQAQTTMSRKESKAVFLRALQRFS